MEVNEGKVLINSVQDLIFEKIKELNDPVMYWGSIYDKQRDVWYLTIFEMDLKKKIKEKYTVSCRIPPLSQTFEVHKQGSNMRPESALFKNPYIKDTADFVVNKLRVNLYRRRQKLQATK